MAVTTSDTVARAQAGLPNREPEARVANVTPPVRWWAAVGAVAVIYIAYSLIHWVTGPYFKTVQQGPTQVPTWMHIELVAWQVLSIPAGLGVLYWFVVRPWRRDGHVGVDGILVIGFSLMWFQDPLSSAVNHWITYNTGMLNFGSWVNSTPGFAAFGQPGAMSSEPILFVPAAYMYMMLIAAGTGCWSMRWARRRWPSISTGLLVLWCYASMCLFDFVLEGVVWLRLGIYEYPGGHWNLWPSTYHPYPVTEMLTIGSVFTGVSCLRFFTDDRGRMWFERGIDRVKGGASKKLALRGLAAVGAIQALMFLGYTIPNVLLAANTTGWPKAIQERSYFTNYICGDGTNRLCPSPALPDTRNGGAYIGVDGKVVIPKGVTLPKQVPFIK